MPLQYVRPGDLVTAEFMNRIIDELQWLRSNIGSGSGATPGTKVAIDHFQPRNSVRIGDELTIFGSGFGLAESNIVTIGSEIVTSFKSGSGGDRLILTVPPMQGIGAGSVVNVTAGNTNGTAKVDNAILILPFQASRVDGDITITPSGNPGNTVSTGVPIDYTFDFKLFSNLDERYDVTATITGTGWRATVKNPSRGNLFVPESRPPAGTTTPITVTVTPGSAASGTLTVKVQSQSNPGFLNTREVRLDLGGSGPAVQDQVTASFANSTGPGGNVNTTTHVAEITADTFVILFFAADVPLTGAATDKFRVEPPTFAKLDDSPATGWTTGTIIPAGEFTLARGGHQPVKIEVRADSQSTTPKDVKMTVKVKSTTRGTAVGEITQPVTRT